SGPAETEGGHGAPPTGLASRVAARTGHQDDLRSPRRDGEVPADLGGRLAEGVFAAQVANSQVRHHVVVLPAIRRARGERREGFVGEGAERSRVTGAKPDHIAAEPG